MSWLKIPVYSLTSGCHGGDFQRLFPVRKRLMLNGVESRLLALNLLRHFRATFASAVAASSCAKGRCLTGNWPVPSGPAAVCDADSRQLRQLAAIFGLCGQHIAPNSLPPFAAFCCARCASFFDLYRCKETVSRRKSGCTLVRSSIAQRLAAML